MVLASLAIQRAKRVGRLSEIEHFDIVEHADRDRADVDRFGLFHVRFLDWVSGIFLTQISQIVQLIYADSPQIMLEKISANLCQSSVKENTRKFAPPCAEVSFLNISLRARERATHRLGALRVVSLIDVRIACNLAQLRVTHRRQHGDEQDLNRE
jgi:hypothetical protein